MKPLLPKLTPQNFFYPSVGFAPVQPPQMMNHLPRTDTICPTDLMNFGVDFQVPENAYNQTNTPSNAFATGATTRQPMPGEHMIPNQYSALATAHQRINRLEKELAEVNANNMKLKKTVEYLRKGKTIDKAGPGHRLSQVQASSTMSRPFADSKQTVEYAQQLKVGLTDILKKAERQDFVQPNVEQTTYAFEEAAQPSGEVKIVEPKTNNNIGGDDDLIHMSSSIRPPPVLVISSPSPPPQQQQQLEEPPSRKRKSRLGMTWLPKPNEALQAAMEGLEHPIKKMKREQQEALEDEESFTEQLLSALDDDVEDEGVGWVIGEQSETPLPTLPLPAEEVEIGIETNLDSVDEKNVSSSNDHSDHNENDEEIDFSQYLQEEEEEYPIYQSIEFVNTEDNSLEELF